MATDPPHSPGTPIQLAAGSAVVEVFPAAGGRIGQIAVGHRALLRGPEHAAAGWANWGSYPLLPWPNRVPGGVIEFEGAAIAVPVTWDDGSAIHGLAADAAWRVDAVSARHVDLSIDIDVDRYHLLGRQTFSLDPGGLEQHLEVVNRADWRVPVGLGIHPWFGVADVRVPADLAWPGDTPVPDGPPRPVDAGDDLRTKRAAPPMDRCFTGLTGSAAEIGDLTLSWSGPITQVVVYSEKPGWVCVEPVTMANDGFRLAADGVRGHGVLALDPGATATASYRFDWS